MIPQERAAHHYNLVRWHDIGRGGHYPAIEVPGEFIEDVRSFAAMLFARGEAG